MHDAVETAKALRRRGEDERHLPDGDGGRGSYEQAVAILREADEPLLLAHTIRHLGDLHRHAQRLELAASCYDEALALYHGHPDAPPLDVANALRSMALLKEVTGDTAGALALWQQAHNIYVALHVKAGVAEARARLATG